MPWYSPNILVMICWRGNIKRTVASIGIVLLLWEIRREGLIKVGRNVYRNVWLVSSEMRGRIGLRLRAHIRLSGNLHVGGLLIVGRWHIHSHLKSVSSININGIKFISNYLLNYNHILKIYCKFLSYSLNLILLVLTNSNASL